MKPIYLDHLATTPLDRRVAETMLAYACQDYGNPAIDTNVFGQAARDAVEEARATIRRAVGAASDGAVIFTSGATEANNLALLGLAARSSNRPRNHIVVSAIEHKSVLEPARWLAQRGFRLSVVAPNRGGLVDPDEVAWMLEPDTLIVSVMAVNNEVGTIQDIEAIGKATRANGTLLHCDATQAVGKVPLDMQRAHIDLLSLSGHKLYGPKGVGALCVGRSDPAALLAPLLHGGGQECGLRSGTLNVPGIAGLAISPREPVAKPTYRLPR